MPTEPRFVDRLRIELHTSFEHLHDQVAGVQIDLVGDGLTELLVAPPWAVRVVLISSDADGASVRAARRAGARGFVAKDELSGQELRQLLETGFSKPESIKAL